MLEIFRTSGVPMEGGGVEPNPNPASACPDASYFFQSLCLFEKSKNKNQNPCSLLSNYVLPALKLPFDAVVKGKRGQYRGEWRSNVKCWWLLLMPTTISTAAHTLVVKSKGKTLVSLFQPHKWPADRLGYQTRCSFLNLSSSASHD